MNNDRDRSPLDAGDFSLWLMQMIEAIAGRCGSEVPCGDCTACCTSSQFVHIGPDETEPLTHIPKELLFPAPGLPRGHLLMGYDETGRCPMMKQRRCSIYQYRPRTCRTYDCRIFAATGGTLRPDQEAIRRQSERWKFSFLSPKGEVKMAAVVQAAEFLKNQSGQLPPESIPANSTQIAVLALCIHRIFLAEDGETGAAKIIRPQPELLLDEVMRVQRLLGKIS